MNPQNSFILTLDEQLTLRQVLMDYKKDNPENNIVGGLITKFDDIRAKNKFQFYYV
jgi:hypothetical protein